MENIKKEIERLEELKFNIDMIDRWTTEDSKRYDEVCKKLRELKESLNKANKS